MTKKISAWDAIKKVYEEKWKMPGKVIDYIAVQKILKACVDGYKNNIIADMTKLPIGYVNDVIVEFFHFYGWKDTLDISPYSWYNRVQKDKYPRTKFLETCFKESNKMTEFEIEHAWYICERYTKILEEIGKYDAYS